LDDVPVSGTFNQIVAWTIFLLDAIPLDAFPLDGIPFG
jgi:hypothetical protein